MKPVVAFVQLSFLVRGGIEEQRHVGLMGLGDFAW